MAAHDLLITTYPGHKSQNVGDNLISHSAIELVRSRVALYQPEVIFREMSLDNFIGAGIRSILAPGFSVSNDSYPTLFRLYSDLNNLDNFFPIGCSFQHPTPRIESFENYEFNDETLRFLRRVAKMVGDEGIPCRDMLIQKLLNRNHVNSHYCGDLGLFDEKFISTNFHPPKKIGSLVFTIQHHHARFDDQAKVLLELLGRQFPSSKKFIAFHSKPGKLSVALADYAATFGFEELHVYGDVDNLSFYESVDLHVGYRLHGHITFLRKRKPSILLIEDCRSFGFANSDEFSTGCFNALDCQTMLGFPDTPYQVMDYLKDQIKVEFSDFKPVFNLIDNTYRKVVSPYFDRFCSLIS